MTTKDNFEKLKELLKDDLALKLLDSYVKNDEQQTIEDIIRSELVKDEDVSQEESEK